MFVEISDEKVEKGRGAVEKSTGRGVEKGKLAAEDRDAILARIAGGTTLDIDCRLTEADAFTCAATDSGIAAIEREAEAAARAAYLSTSPRRPNSTRSSSAP